MGGITTLNMPNGGTRVIDDRTGKGFHISTSGERLSIADGLDCSCGPEFTRYVRFYLDSFPYSHLGPRNRDVDNLWVYRKLKLKLSAHYSFDVVASVVSWEEWNMGPYSDRTEWAVIVRLVRNEFNTFNIGDLVKYKESMATIANIHDKSIDIKFNGQTLSVEKDSLQVIKQLRFKVEKMDVLEGGLLAISDEFVSNEDEVTFEWIDPPHPYYDENFDCNHGMEDLDECGVHADETLLTMLQHNQKLLTLQQHVER